MMEDLNGNFIDDAYVEIDGQVLDAFDFFGMVFYGGLSGLDIPSDEGSSHSLVIDWEGATYGADVTMPDDINITFAPSDDADSTGSLSVNYSIPTAPMQVVLDIHDSKLDSESQPEPLMQSGATSGTFTIPANYLSPTATIELTLAAVNYTTIDSASTGSGFEASSTATASFTTQ
jgi:hypothetical protein